MKDQGIIRIIDVVGTVFERTLTHDEIIELLLKREDVTVAVPAKPERQATRPGGG